MSGFTAQELEELRAKAEAATGGDWRAHITSKRSPEIYTNVPPPNTPNPKIAGTVLRKRDAEFIAALNPATALRLIQSAELVSDLVGAIEGFLGSFVLAHDLSPDASDLRGDSLVKAAQELARAATIAKAKAGGA